MRSQALGAFVWSFIERFGRQFIQFGFSVVLARLLPPEDFGLIAMMMIFVALSQTLIDSGFGQAIIQDQKVNDRDLSSVFWFNLSVGCMMSLLLFFGAGKIAAFYREPMLSGISRLMAVGVLLNSLAVVHNARLVKELKFKARAQVILAGIAISGVLALVAALAGCGVWALVLQMLSMNCAQTIGFWMIDRWRPAFQFDRTTFRRLFQFGGNMLVADCINTVFDNIYSVVIGKVYQAEQLGYYYRARRVIWLGAESTSRVVSQVNFPLLSRIQDDPKRMLSMMRKVIRLKVGIIVPVMTLVGVMADDFIVVVFGDKWMPAVPLLRWLCVIGLFYPVQLLNVNALLAMGKSRKALYLELIKKLFFAVMLLLTWRHGIQAMLAGQLASSMVALIVNTYYIGKYLGYGLLKQLGDLWRIFVSGACMFLALFAVQLMLPVSPWQSLAVTSIVGIAVFLFAEWAQREPGFLLAKDMCKERLSKNS